MFPVQNILFIFFIIICFLVKFSAFSLSGKMKKFPVFPVPWPPELIRRGQPWIHDSVTARSTALAFNADNETYKDLIFFDVAGKGMSCPDNILGSVHTEIWAIAKAKFFFDVFRVPTFPDW